MAINRVVSEPKLPIIAAAIYGALVLLALVVTLRSLSGDTFDGLNNMLQIPLALPWWLVVPAPTSHRADAFLTAALGMANAGLVYLVLRRLVRGRSSRA